MVFFTFVSSEHAQSSGVRLNKCIRSSWPRRSPSLLFWNNFGLPLHLLLIVRWFRFTGAPGDIQRVLIVARSTALPWETKKKKKKIMSGFRKHICLKSKHATGSVVVPVCTILNMGHKEQSQELSEKRQNVDFHTWEKVKATKPSPISSRVPWPQLPNS